MRRYKRRWIVERTNAWLGQFRRLLVPLCYTGHILRRLKVCFIFRRSDASDASEEKLLESTYGRFAQREKMDFK
jgi:hypothetical protein